MGGRGARDGKQGTLWDVACRAGRMGTGLCCLWAYSCAMVALLAAGGWALGAALNQSLSVCSSGSSSTTGKQAHAAAAAAAGASQPDQQPLCRAVLMTVPSLDPLGALLERRDYELGDPRVSPEVYDGMTAWSPYDGLLGHNMQSTDVGPGRDVYAAVSVRSFAEGGLARQEQQQQQPPPCYPALLLRIGLYDTEVPYWEPARYMARLRRLGMGRRRSLPLLMQVSGKRRTAVAPSLDAATIKLSRLAKQDSITAGRHRYM